MNGYVEGGYVVVFVTIPSYAASLLRREFVLKRRLKRDVPVEPRPDGTPSVSPSP